MAPQASQAFPDSTALLLTVPEVAKILRRSKARIYEMVHMKELPAIRDGKSILIPADAPEAWIKLKRRQNGW